MHIEPFVKAPATTPEAVLLFAGVIFVGDIGRGVATEDEGPTVPYEPAGDILSTDRAISETTLVNVSPGKAANPRLLSHKGLEFFSCLDPAIPGFA